MAREALVFEGKCCYDLTLGADFLTKTGIDINYSTGTMHWFENVRPKTHLNSIAWSMMDTRIFHILSAYYTKIIQQNPEQHCKVYF